MNIPPEDILVTIEHPFGEIEATLAEWITKGADTRPGVRATHPRLKATGQPLPPESIPPEYQFAWQLQHLRARGLLPSSSGNQQEP